MVARPVSDDVLMRAVRAYRKYGSYLHAAIGEALGDAAGHSMKRWVTIARQRGMFPDFDSVKRNQHGGNLLFGTPESFNTIERPVPTRGVKRYLLTCAQNNTKVFDPFWKNLLILKKYYNAELLISQFTYNKAAYGQKAVKPGFDPTADDLASLWYDTKIIPFVSNDRIRLAPGLVWCGELNILPTAADPTSGLQSYTGRDSSILPHAKIAMRPIPANKGSGAKFIYTTGAVTQRNYIKKKEGFKAEFHHAYGAALVEVCDDGVWFVRQINSDNAGSIYDLDVKIVRGRVRRNQCEVITPGDIHVPRQDDVVIKTIFGKGGMVDVLRPKHLVLHDLFDFLARNHHDRFNPHQRFKLFIMGLDSVEDEMNKSAQFLKFVLQPWRKFIRHIHVIHSNHTQALERWLREADYRFDERNAIFFLEAQLEFYRSLARRDRAFHIVEWALRRAGCPDRVHFLKKDEILLIGGVQHDLHGHDGADGMRGSASLFMKIGRKVTSAHTHSAGIWCGHYRAGKSCLNDMDYNAGLSSWSDSVVIQHENDKRQIITIWRGRWRGVAI